MKVVDMKYAFVGFVLTNSVWIFVVFKDVLRFQVSFVNNTRTIPSKILTRTSPLLVLFTSWNSSMESGNVYNNTLFMWRELGSDVSLVLFTNDTKTKTIAESFNWKVLPLRRTSCNGIPILKDMFTTAMATYNESKFFGYSNSDILFNKGLKNTLTMILNQTLLLKRAPVLITGRRIDSPVGLTEQIRTWTYFDRVSLRGLMSNAFALDYFIMTKGFNWKEFPDLVIGRPKIDNWLIFYARRKGVTVIDASASITALHQKTKKRKKIVRECNKEILMKSRRIKFLQNKVVKGNAECAHYETRYLKTDILTLIKRGLYSTGC
ncbi:uncharacterized protein [Argopecten irradians]|uniref:uncharacterized protein n=1 Tax=Argopecten irradians TaxID=31199 RepID=UPI0037129FDC